MVILVRNPIERENSLLLGSGDVLCPHDLKILPDTWLVVHTGVYITTLWIYPPVFMNFVENQELVTRKGITKFYAGMAEDGEIVVYLYNNKHYPVAINEGSCIGRVRFERITKNINIYL